MMPLVRASALLCSNNQAVVCRPKLPVLHEVLRSILQVCKQRWNGDKVWNVHSPARSLARDCNKSLSCAITRMSVYMGTRISHRLKVPSSKHQTDLMKSHVLMHVVPSCMTYKVSTSQGRCTFNADISYSSLVDLFRG